MNRSIRKRLNLERLEDRSLLAVGLIPIDLAIPLNQTSDSSDFTVDGDATIKLKAMVLDPTADDATDVSLTGYEFSGSGNFSGNTQGIEVSGPFITNPNPSGTAPAIPIQVNPDTQTIDLVLTQDGTFTANSILGAQPGTFTIVLMATLDFNTHAIRGTSYLTFQTGDQIENSQAPFQLDGALASDLEFPDASKASISGRVFNDANNDGTLQESETGVPDIRAVRVTAPGALGVELESLMTDANGYYAFYNLDASETSIRLRDLPTELDFGKMATPQNPLLDSVANSIDGIAGPILFTTEPHRQHIDAGLRTTPFEFQNPNLKGDVNNDGRQTAADALEIINLLSRLPAGVNDLALSSDRKPGDAFVDVDGNGRVSAGDALAVIFSLQASEGTPASEPEMQLELSWLAGDKTRPGGFDDDAASGLGLF